jgi:hypothetical protein
MRPAWVTTHLIVSSIVSTNAFGWRGVGALISRPLQPVAEVGFGGGKYRAQLISAPRVGVEQILHGLVRRQLLQHLAERRVCTCAGQRPVGFTSTTLAKLWCRTDVVGGEEQLLALGLDLSCELRQTERLRRLSSCRAVRLSTWNRK